jgi:hypothetical protein
MGLGPVNRLFRPGLRYRSARYSMIWVEKMRIGDQDKTEKTSYAHPARRLVIEWTTALPAPRRGPRPR